MVSSIRAVLSHAVAAADARSYWRAVQTIDSGKCWMTYWSAHARQVVTSASQVPPFVSATADVTGAVRRLATSAASIRPSLTQAARAFARLLARKLSNIAPASATMLAGLP